MVSLKHASLALNLILSTLLLLREMSSSPTLSCITQELQGTSEVPRVVSPALPLGTRVESNIPSQNEGDDGIPKKPFRKRHLKYDPSRDRAYQNMIYGEGNRTYKALTPNPSMMIQVRPKRIITLDEAVHAYDLWFEETAAFNRLSWLGVSMQQDPSDAIAIQQMLYHIKPDLVIEVGTNTGGGAIFYSSIMRTYNASAKVLTLDIKDVSNWKDGAKTGSELKQCDRCVMGNEHPYWTDGGIHFKIGKITNKPDCQFMAEIRKFVEELNPQTVVVIEDASHQYRDVKVNIEALHSFVTPKSYLLVQDTKIDRLFRGRIRGPLLAIEEFLAGHPNFSVDRRYEWLMYSQHHLGWLYRNS